MAEVRVLLDENLPRKLVGRLGGDVDATTMAEAGWRGKKNGELLRLAEKEFDASSGPRTRASRTSRTSPDWTSPSSCCAREATPWKIWNL